jgi:hypothetical protein
MSEGPRRESGMRRCERVFVLRVWHERGNAAGDVTRGSIFEIESGRRFFFSELRDLHDFLSLRLSTSDAT